MKAAHAMARDGGRFRCEACRFEASVMRDVIAHAVARQFLVREPKRENRS